MFDVGFSELILLFIIGLLVLGPEKLPQVANKLGGWVGQARRMTRMLRSQIEEELEFSKVRESVNQPLSSMMDKPAAKPKPEPKADNLDYEEGEDDESGFGETGHADASEPARDRPVPDPAAPGSPADGESGEQPGVSADGGTDVSPPQSEDTSGGESKTGGEDGEHSRKDTTSSS